MYILPKFLSKIIKKDGFILISPSGQKFIIGEPKKKDNLLEVKVSKKFQNLNAITLRKMVSEYIISEDITFNKAGIEVQVFV